MNFLMKLDTEVCRVDMVALGVWLTSGPAGSADGVACHPAMSKSFTLNSFLVSHE